MKELTEFVKKTTTIEKKRKRRKPSIVRSQSAKRSWKMSRQRRTKAIKRAAKSPAGRQRYRELSRRRKTVFNDSYAGYILELLEL